MNEGIRQFLIENMTYQFDAIIKKYEDVIAEKGQKQANIEFLLAMEVFEDKFAIQCELENKFTLDAATDAMAVVMLRVGVSFLQAGVIAKKASDGLWRIGTPEDLARDPLLYPRPNTDGNDE